jgi:hypothetical protein
MPDRALSIESISLTPPADGATEYVVVHQPLQRILAFTGLSIDDIIDQPIARNTVYGYFKLYKQILRTSEVVDLERQWNPLRLTAS